MTRTQAHERAGKARAWWSSLQPFEKDKVRLPGNRSAAGMTLGPDGRLYVAGGESAVGAMSAAVYQLNASGSAFVARAALPSPRAYHGFVTLRDGRIASLGGALTASRLDAVDTYDPAADAWR